MSKLKKIKLISLLLRNRKLERRFRVSTQMMRRKMRIKMGMKMKMELKIILVSMRKRKRLKW